MENNQTDIVDPVRLILQHMKLECKGITAEGLIERISGPYPDDIPNFYVAKHTKGTSVYTSKDLPQVIREKLKQLQVENSFSDFVSVKNIMGEYYPQNGPSHFISYIFFESINPKIFPDMVLLNDSHRQMFHDFEPDSKFPIHTSFGAIVNGMLVSVCESSREDSESAESWVRTLEKFRGKGYGKQVTLAWANNLLKIGKVPFYSHTASNLYSSYLANSLGLLKISDEMSY